jgi:cytochrome c1
MVCPPENTRVQADVLAEAGSQADTDETSRKTIPQASPKALVLADADSQAKTEAVSSSANPEATFSQCCAILHGTPYDANAAVSAPVSCHSTHEADETIASSVSSGTESIT